MKLKEVEERAASALRLAVASYLAGPPTTPRYDELLRQVSGVGEWVAQVLGRHPARSWVLERAREAVALPRPPRNWYGG